MKKLSDEQKMKRYIFRMRAFGIISAICSATFYAVRFLPHEGRHMPWIQAAAIESLPLIFLFGASVTFGIVGIVKVLLAKAGEYQERSDGDEYADIWHYGGILNDGLW